MCLRRTVVVATALLTVAACSGSGNGTGTSRQRSSMVTVAAMPGPAPTVPAPPGGPQTIAVDGGTVTLQSASFSIQRVHIEEDAEGEGAGEHQGGEQQGGEQQGGEHQSGEHQSGGQQGGGQQGGGQQGGGQQGGGQGQVQEDVVIEGPFAIDIASGGAVLQSVAVFPGTFRRAELEPHLEAQPPFDGDSIVIQGQFQPTGGGAAIPFTLQSHLVRELEVPIANGGVTVASNTTVAFTVTFDLAAMFAHLDLHSAVVEGGAIAIDDSHNAAVLASFEHHLEDALEGCEGHH
jgi:hypothetical protein